MTEHPAPQTNHDHDGEAASRDRAASQRDQSAARLQLQSNVRDAVDGDQKFTAERHDAMRDRFAASSDRRAAAEDRRRSAELLARRDISTDPGPPRP
jgi:hypothetical protein